MKKNKIFQEENGQTSAEIILLMGAILIIVIVAGNYIFKIFVVYFPRYNKPPSVESWKKDGRCYKNKFKDRFCILSYRYKIYPWLKDEILPNIDANNTYLRSAVEQYVDYLEGEFNLRNINKNMNKELQEFLRDKLKINEVEPATALNIVSEKIQDAEIFMKQLEYLRDEIFFSKCYKELTDLKFDAVDVIESYPYFHPMSVGVKLCNELTVWIGKSDDDGLFCQVNKNDKKEILPKAVKMKFKKVFSEHEVDDNDKENYICAYLEYEENALNYLIEFCEKMK